MDNFFYFPPHPGPKQKIPREQLSFYEKTGKYTADRKFGGIHAVIHVYYRHSDWCEVEMWDRRGARLVNYRLTPSMIACFGALRYSLVDDYVFAGELMHTKAMNKTTGKQALTNTIILFDVLYRGKYLSGVPQTDRRAMLYALCGDPKQIEQGNRALIVKEVGESKLWVAETFKDDFLYRFDEFFDTYPNTDIDRYPEIEGLVLRQKDGMLGLGDRAGDVPWLIRCRKEKPKTYRF